jgi:hypothetical protein
MRRVLFYGSAAVAVVCLLTAPVLADVTVIGDRSAYDEALAAFKKLFSLPGFRAKVTSPQGQGLMEFAPPDSYHLTSHTQNSSFEAIKVGGTVATKGIIPGAPAGWRCSTAKPTDKLLIDLALQRGTGTFNVSRGPDTVIDGTPVHTIFSAKDGGEKDTIYVGAQSGLPKQVIAGGGRQTIDYYDYGAHVAIPPPACAP